MVFGFNEIATNYKIHMRLTMPLAQAPISPHDIVFTLATAVHQVNQYNKKIKNKSRIHLQMTIPVMSIGWVCAGFRNSKHKSGKKKKTPKYNPYTISNAFCPGANETQLFCLIIS